MTVSNSSIPPNFRSPAWIFCLGRLSIPSRFILGLPISHTIARTTGLMRPVHALLRPRLATDRVQLPVRSDKHISILLRPLFDFIDICIAALLVFDLFQRLADLPRLETVTVPHLLLHPILSLVLVLPPTDSIQLREQTTLLPILGHDDAVRVGGVDRVGVGCGRAGLRVGMRLGFRRGVVGKLWVVGRLLWLLLGLLRLGY